MSVELADLIARVRTEVGDEPWQDYLTAPVAASTTPTMTVNNPTAWAEGDVVEFADNSGEEVRVLVTPTVNPVSIKRGHNSSNAVQHASGVYLNKNARFGYNEIALSINRTLHRMWPLAWSKRTFTVTPPNPDDNTRYFAVPLDLQDIISVSQKRTGTAAAWQSYGTRGAGWPVLLRSGLPQTDFGTGKAVWFPAGFQNLTNPVEVAYRSVMELADVDEGLAADTVVFGACVGILRRSQMIRSGQDVRQAEPGTTTSYLQDVQYFEQEFQHSLRKLHIYLTETIPAMRTWTA